MLTAYRNRVAAILSYLLIVFPSVISGQEATGPVKFSLRSIDGGQVTEADVRGKVVVFIVSSSQRT